MRTACVVVLLVTAAWVGASETAYGTYEPNNRMMYPDLARLNFRNLAKHGFTTSTVSGNADGNFCTIPHVGLARQVDMMIEEGLARKDKPMLALSCDLNDILKARTVAKYPERWPELVAGNVDEPNYTKIKTVRQYCTDANNLGLRSGTAIAGYGLFWVGDQDPHDGVLADWLNLWIVLASTWQTDLYDQAREYGAQLYSYWAYNRDPDRDRYVAGLWCWKWNPEVMYFWAYNHSGMHGRLPNGEWLDDPQDKHSLAFGSPTGPIETPSLLAVAEGIKDHALLDRLETSGKGGAWLKELKDSIPVAMPGDPKPVPRTDFEAIRKQARRLLEE